MADSLEKMEARIRELEAQRAKGKDVPELDALYAKMDAANRKGADEAAKTVTGETPPVKKAKGGDVKVKKMAFGGMGSRPAPTPPPAASRMAPPMPAGRPMPAPPMPAGRPMPAMQPGNSLGTAPSIPQAPQKLDPRYMKKGGAVKSASARADGCAIRGKTRA
jgi:hypothetical protein